jgi:hypothetical protein
LLTFNKILILSFIAMCLSLKNRAYHQKHVYCSDNSFLALIMTIRQHRDAETF